MMTVLAVVLVSNPENADTTYSKFGSFHQQNSHLHSEAEFS
jgi:hypothetical protein